MKEEILKIIENHQGTLPARNPGSFYTAVNFDKYEVLATELEEYIKAEKEKAYEQGAEWASERGGNEYPKIKQLKPGMRVRQIFTRLIGEVIGESNIGFNHYNVKWDNKEEIIYHYGEYKETHRVYGPDLIVDE